MNDEQMEKWLAAIPPVIPDRNVIADVEARLAGGARIRAGTRSAVRWALAASVLLAVSGWCAAGYFGARYRAVVDRSPPPTAVAVPATRPADQVLLLQPAKVVETRGLVLAMAGGFDSAIPVTAESPLPPDRSLWTCPWGGASVRFGDGLSVELDRSTEVSMSESGVVRNAVLKNGILYVTRHASDKEGAVVIRTPQASITVSNGQVAVAIQGGRTLVEVAVGTVQVAGSAGGQALSVSAGHYTTVDEKTQPLKAFKGRFIWRLEPPEI